MLAPAVFVSHMKSVPFRLLSDLYAANLFQEAGVREFLPSVKLLQSITSDVCVDIPQACSNALFTLVGYDPQDMNDTMLPKYLEYYPAGTSVKNINHWAQMVRYQGRYLRMYDYGTKCTKWIIFQQSCNQHKYGQVNPPVYDLREIEVQMVVFWGGKDLLADADDVGKLLESIDIRYVDQDVYIESFNHLDFVLGWNAYQRLYPKVLKFLDLAY
eukprot:TRINITY_DN8136_c0_g1_i1.p2 TRINITY_DN8136_c0_g1~~TRINITY_DN8136_c0_g1_i1.p2  ORF type:complete len:214 (+),score=22.22 TRINITY_DN8136_c0_g1_i1:133-774(+)